MPGKITCYIHIGAFIVCLLALTYCVKTVAFLSLDLKLLYDLAVRMSWMVLLYTIPIMSHAVASYCAFISQVSFCIFNMVKAIWYRLISTVLNIFERAVMGAVCRSSKCNSQIYPMGVRDVTKYLNKLMESNYNQIIIKSECFICFTKRCLNYRSMDAPTCPWMHLLLHAYCTFLTNLQKYLSPSHIVCHSPGVAFNINVHSTLQWQVLCKTNEIFTRCVMKRYQHHSAQTNWPISAWVNVD